ncbi:hypothetical protein BGZ54_003155 [Gamsiella multidivaricata]|nr:hypothetical protein BGZ54_003155 [Gamsiella multidivaricata]
MSANFVFLRSPQEVDLVESMQPIRSRKPSIQLLKFGRTRELPIIPADLEYQIYDVQKEHPDSNTEAWTPKPEADKDEHLDSHAGICSPKPEMDTDENSMPIWTPKHGHPSLKETRMSIQIQTPKHGYPSLKGTRMSMPTWTPKHGPSLKETRMGIQIQTLKHGNPNLAKYLRVLKKQKQRFMEINLEAHSAPLSYRYLTSTTYIAFLPHNHHRQLAQS